MTLLGKKKESRTWMQQTVSLLTAEHEWISTLDVPTSFFQNFLGSNDIKVVKFECMYFKVWRSNRPLSLTLSEAHRCGNSRVKAFAYLRYFQVLILGDVGSL